MKSETLGRNARRLIRTPLYSSIGIIIAVLAVTALSLYWVTPDAVLTPVVSIGVPVAVVAYLAVVFATAARTKQ